MANAKIWYQSKILWFNALVAALAALEMSANVLQPYVPSNVYAYGLLVLTVGNAVLRVITNQAITFSGGNDANGN